MLYLVLCCFCVLFYALCFFSFFCSVLSSSPVVIFHSLYCCLSFCVCFYVLYFVLFFFFKQKPAYEMRISYWSSDVCSSDLVGLVSGALRAVLRLVGASLVDSVSRRLVALDQFIRTATLLAIDLVSLDAGSILLGSHVVAALGALDLVFLCHTFHLLSRESGWCGTWLLGHDLQHGGRLLVGQGERATGTHLEERLIGEERGAAVRAGDTRLGARALADGEELPVDDDQDRVAGRAGDRGGRGLGTEAPPDQIGRAHV